jgi:hypothetical protein
MPATSGCNEAGSAVAPPLRKFEKAACWTGQTALLLLNRAEKSLLSLV